jgi:hypothetical protein
VSAQTKAKGGQAKPSRSAKVVSRHIQPAATKPVKTTLAAIRKAVAEVMKERGGAKA